METRATKALRVEAAAADAQLEGTLAAQPAEVLNLIVESLAADEDVLKPRDLGSLSRSCKLMKAAVKAAPGVALALATRDDAGKGALLCQAPDAGAPRLLAVGDRWREGERRGDTAVTPPVAVSLERASVYADRGCG